MPRKRKVVVPEVIPEAPTVKKTTEVHTIIQCTQKNETFHNKYLKDLQIVYSNVSLSCSRKTKNLIKYNFFFLFTVKS